MSAPTWPEIVVALLLLASGVVVLVAASGLIRLPNFFARMHAPALASTSLADLPAKLAEYGMTASMSRKGNCWDNAPTESFFNSLKNERVHGARYTTRAEATADLFEYIEVFYNRSRRHSTLGYSSPVRFLENWISKHAAQQSMAA